MLQLFVLAILLALGATEPDSEPVEAAPRHIVHHEEHERFDHRDHRVHHDLPLNRYGHHNHQGQREHHNHDLHDPHKAHDDILSKQYKIIEHVYSPDYYEPSLVLDYRYLKSGGREYVRGPGGQILILPHGVHADEKTDHKDFDSLLEFLRLRHKATLEGVMQRHEDEQHGYHHHRRGPEMRFT